MVRGSGLVAVVLSWNSFAVKSGFRTDGTDLSGGLVGRLSSVLLACVFLLAFASVASAADPVKDGLEIQVSDDSASYFPRIAADPQGNFLVIWEQDDTVQGRRFFADGNEFLPQFAVSGKNHYVGAGNSSSTGNVAVAADPVGNFVVTYTASDYTYSYSGYAPCYGQPCLWGRRNLEAGGLGASFTVQNPVQTSVYAESGDDQVSNPEITNRSNGEFVIVWESYDAHYSEAVSAAQTTKIGQRKGSVFQVNAGEAYQGQYGDLAAASDGDENFVVVYRDEYDYGALGGTLRIQRYDDKSKPVGDHFGASSNDHDGRNADIAQAPDGTFMTVWDYDGGLYGRIFSGDGTPVTADLTISTSNDGYPAVAASDAAFVVVWTDDEVMGKRFDLTGAAISSEFQANTSLGGYWPDVAAIPSGDFTVAWKDDDGYVDAQQFRVALEAPVEHLLAGKSLLLKNVVPDNPEKNKGKWKSSMSGIEVPGRGTDGDPRCNGKPDGTVKAVLRFLSLSSGHDTGPIPLPCEYWTVTGSSSVTTVHKRGYKYNDAKLAAGPCNSVKISGDKVLNVSCKGKKNVVGFPYDLEVGTSDATLTAMLEMGLHRYCSDFPAFGGADGSDGKKFRGKLAAAPASCAPGFFTLGQCGNSVIGFDEVCDDGNTLDGDLCSADCKRVTAICGDGATGPGEACDDGNTAGGDYCSANCLFETAVCGDSLVGPGEGCDDGNTAGGDYCSADCRFETAICGDSLVGPGEACDDGNTAGGDYCSADCKAVTAICGDGIQGAGECCDDGNTTPGDGCEATCDSGFLCPACNYDPGDYLYCSLDQCGPCPEGVGNCRNDSECEVGLECVRDVGTDYGFPYWVDVCSLVVCGDGIAEGSEACDDGNTSGGDYCSADCSEVTAVCGDASIGIGEQCDDGGTTPGDGCDASCAIEGIQSETEPNDTFGTADPIVVGSPAVPGLLRGGIVDNDNELDYFAFTLASASTVNLETRPYAGGVVGDTRMWLYDASAPGTPLAFNDDAGNGLYSFISGLAVPAGSYLILVDEYGNDGDVDYDLFISVAP